MSRIFGEIPGFTEGYIFSNRIELSLSSVHAPRQAGISGSQQEGADSIVISGGYEDDEDRGDVILYTGHGGRDLNSGKQVTDQVLAKGNLALAISCQRGLPVRVIRGVPEEADFNYRYDGLFRVEDYWKETGKSGYLVWRFRLVKLKFENQLNVKEEEAEYKRPKRSEVSIQGIIRDTEVCRTVKLLYNFECQVCGSALITSAGRYAEAAHIQPLGAPHHGPDVLENVLCLCPNHHVMFDFGGFSILPDLSLIGMKGKLTLHKKHQVATQFLQYHLHHFYDEKNRS